MVMARVLHSILLFNFAGAHGLILRNNTKTKTSDTKAQLAAQPDPAPIVAVFPPVEEENDLFTAQIDPERRRTLGFNADATAGCMNFGGNSKCVSRASTTSRTNVKEEEKVEEEQKQREPARSRFSWRRVLTRSTTVKNMKSSMATAKTGQRVRSASEENSDEVHFKLYNNPAHMLSSPFEQQKTGAEMWKLRTRRVVQAKKEIENVRRMYYERIPGRFQNPGLEEADLKPIASHQVVPGMFATMKNAVKSSSIRHPLGKVLIAKNQLVKIVKAGDFKTKWLVKPVTRNSSFSQEVALDNLRFMSKVANDQLNHMAKFVWPVLEEAVPWYNECELALQTKDVNIRFDAETKALESFRDAVVHFPELFIHELQGNDIPALKESVLISRKSLFDEAQRPGSAGRLSLQGNLLSHGDEYLLACMSRFGVNPADRTHIVDNLLEVTNEQKYRWHCDECQLLFGDYLVRCPLDKSNGGNVCVNCSQQQSQTKKKK